MKVGLIGIAGRPVLDGDPEKICAPHTIIYHLAKGLEKRGHSAIVFSVEESSDELIKVTCGLHKLKRARPDYNTKTEEYNKIFTEEAIKYFKEKKIDLINCHDLRYNKNLYVETDTPVLFTVHLQMRKFPDTDLDYCRDKKISFATISREGELLCQEKGLSIAGYTPNGVDTDKFAFSKNKRSGVLFAGRIHENKGVEVAIKAAILAKQKITLVGPVGTKDEDKKFFEKIRTAYFDNELVEYAGEKTQDELAEYYKNAGVMILLSESEGMPLTILEAMSTGLPVIGSRIGGIEDIIEDGKNGFLIESRDEKLIAEKIIEAKKIDNNKCRQRVVENFSLGVMVENYIKAYENFLALMS